MANLLKDLKSKELIQPPQWMPDNVVLLVLTGSTSYGASMDDGSRVSDWDMVGICVPPKRIVFPSFAGFIPGFGSQGEVFDKPWQKHHVFDQTAMKGKGRQYDFNIYSIVKYFQLAMENNPNIIDVLFSPIHCIHQTTDVGELIMQNRHLFLSKKSFHTFTGYANKQIKLMNSAGDEPKESEYRQGLIDQFGYDTKRAYHVVRLALEGEQILSEGTLTLDRNGELLKVIRRGEWTKEELLDWFKKRQEHLQRLYDESDAVPWKADEEKLRALLIQCLEMHYGSLKDALEDPGADRRTLTEIRALLDQRGI